MYKRAFNLGRTLGNVFASPGIGLGKGLGGALFYPALGIGGGLAAGVGLPYGTYKLMQHLGERGKQQTLEKQIQLAKMHQTALGQPQQEKLSSEAPMKGYGLLGRNSFEKLAKSGLGGDPHAAHKATIDIGQAAAGGASAGAPKMRQVPVPASHYNQPLKRSAWNRWGKWGLGAGLAGLGAYGLYRALRKSPEQQQMPQMPMYQ